MPSRELDKSIVAAAKADPDAQPLSLRQLKSMVPMRTTGAAEVKDEEVTCLGSLQS
jgi:hypothetical protein